MIHGYITHTNNEPLIKRVARTNNFFERMRGLLFSPPLKNDEGLLIVPCSSVHTFGMSYPIDLVFLDKKWTITKTVQALKPWRMSASSSAYMVLELATNKLKDLHLTVGQRLEWHDEA